MEQKPEEDKTEEESLEKPEQPSTETSDPDSLENPSTVDETKKEKEGDSSGKPEGGEGVTDTTGGAKIEKKPKALSGINKLSVINIYLLLFILLIVLALVIVYISYQRNKAEEQKSEAALTEPLSDEALEQLRQTDVRVGDPKQILSVESNAIFSGNVLIRKSLEVAGQLKIGEPLELPGLTVSGASNLDQLRANKLEISGDTTIQGQLSLQESLSVGGDLTVAGNLSASRLTLNSLSVSRDLTVNRHISAGGGTPGRSNGNALGSGGTSSISGGDTAGTVNINTGSGAGSGCFVHIRFANPYDSTPHVVITPVGSAAGSLDFYINRSSSGFSICSASSVGGGKSFSFDYIVIN